MILFHDLFLFLGKYFHYLPNQYLSSMSSFDPRVDAYIEKSAPFAKPILNHLRTLFHQHCPDATETVKWGFPHFDYNGRSLFNMAGFKQHCSVGFWLAGSMSDPAGIFADTEKEGMGSLGKIRSMEDLPSDKILAQYIKEAMKLADMGVKMKKTAKKEVVEIAVPDYFQKALQHNKKALATFEKFAPSHRKEYLEWIIDAKREETRQKRIEQAIEWMAEGKARHWKYER